MNTFQLMELTKLQNIETESSLISFDTPENVSILNSSVFASFDPLHAFERPVLSCDGTWRTVYETPIDVLRKRPEWASKEYRDAYAEAAVEQGIAWQLRVNREARGLSQAEFAYAANTRQSVVSRMEDPEYGGHSLKKLVEFAAALDCALAVKLVSFSELARDSECLSQEHLFVPSYHQEVGE